MNMIGSKHSAIESAVDFISILCAFFPAVHFNVTEVSLTSKIEHQKLSVLCTCHGRNACWLQSFSSKIVFISVEWTSDDVFLNFLKKSFLVKLWSLVLLMCTPLIRLTLLKCDQVAIHQEWRYYDCHWRLSKLCLTCSKRQQVWKLIRTIVKCTSVFWLSPSCQ